MPDSSAQAELPSWRGLAAQLFDDSVVVEEVSPLPEVADLLPDEERFVAHAASVRRREFAAGRHCARRALTRLGIEGFAVRAAPDRAPIWPRGVVGSISHTHDFCVAAVARRADAASVGVDAEPNEPLDAELLEIVCSPTEREWLARQPEAERGPLARLIFSAKECTYKCQYPLSHAFLEFEDVAVDLDLQRNRFAATLLRSVGACLPVGTRLQGAFSVTHRLIVTGIVLRGDIGK